MTDNDAGTATRHTVPDLDTLWLASTTTAYALNHNTHHSDAHHLSWRITVTDWQHILRVSGTGKWAGAVQADYQAQDPNMIYQLFGHPVTVVNPEPERWPELVISIDRRN